MISSITHEASDIRSSFILERLPISWRPYARLMRLDRPIGSWLLFFPCLWGLAAALPHLSLQDGPRVIFGWLPWFNVILFALGTIIMRGAGCTLNDILDAQFDAEVARTRTRPIPNGEISKHQALIFFVMLCLLGGVILIPFNNFARLVALLSMVLLVPYPLMKRMTYWPQAWLGLAFNYGILLGYAVINAHLSVIIFILYAAGWCWTMGYDTIYAHQDKEDDLLISVKSTALLFGSKLTIPLISVFYSIMIILLCLCGLLWHLSLIFYIIMALTAGLLSYQILSFDMNDPQNCLIQFKRNKWVGFVVMLALLLGKLSL